MNDKVKALFPGVGFLKTIATVVSSIIVIYAAMWSMGIAPITNSRADEMIDMAVTEVKENIKVRLDDIQFKQTQIRADLGSLSVKERINNERLKRIQEDTRAVREDIKSIFEIIVKGRNTP